MSIDIEDIKKLDIVNKANIVLIKDIEIMQYITIKNIFNRNLYNVSYENVKMMMKRYPRVLILDTEGNYIESNQKFTERREYVSEDIPY